MIFRKLVRYIKKRIYSKTFSYKWRKKNRHNSTVVIYPFDIESVEVGKGTYGELTVFNDISDRKLIIGNYCSIALEVTFILGLDHPINCISTFPFKNFYEEGNPHEAVSKGNIIVGDDVWIGFRSTILSGVHIGQGAVIAAGAVVTSNVPPYAIVGGVPAKVIKYRFEQPVIDFLLTLDYGSVTEDLIKQHIHDLYKPIDAMSLDDIKNLYSWFTKKSL